MSIKKKILVTGACRSGTTSTSKYLRDLGLNVPHEKMGRDGTVSCVFFTDAPYYPKSADKPMHEGEGKFSDYDFETIIHLVRYPLHAITSQASYYSKMHKQWLDEIGFVNIEVKPNILHAAVLWEKVNEYVESIADFRVNIEYLNQDLRPFLEKKFGGLNAQTFVRHMNKSSGFYKKKSISWKQLERLDKDLCEKIKYRSERYGYYNIPRRWK